MYQIKSRCCETVICEGRTANVALWQAVRDGVSLAYADLGDIAFGGIDIPRADLSHADLRGCNFETANLKGANLTGALLQGASFRRANLTNVNYTDTDLIRSTYHSGAIMSGAYTDPIESSNTNPCAEISLNPPEASSEERIANWNDAVRAVRERMDRAEAQIAVAQMEREQTVAERCPEAFVTGTGVEPPDTFVQQWANADAAANAWAESHRVSDSPLSPDGQALTEMASTMIRVAEVARLTAESLDHSVTYNAEAGRWTYRLRLGTAELYHGHDRAAYERAKRRALGRPEGT